MHTHVVNFGMVEFEVDEELRGIQSEHAEKYGKHQGGDNANHGHSVRQSQHSIADNFGNHESGDKLQVPQRNLRCVVRALRGIRRDTYLPAQSFVLNLVVLFVSKHIRIRFAMRLRYDLLRKCSGRRVGFQI